MMEIALSGVVSYSTVDQYRNNYYVLAFESNSKEIHKGKVFIGFNSDQMYDYFRKNIGNKIDITVFKHISSNNKPYYTLKNASEVSELNDSELTENEDMSLREDKEKIIKKYFEKGVDFSVGNIVVHTRTVGSILKKSAYLEVECWLVMDIEDGKALLKKSTYNKERTTNIKNCKDYYTCESTKVLKFISEVNSQNLNFNQDRIMELQKECEYNHTEAFTPVHDPNEVVPMFDYFNDKDKFRLTIQIGQFLKRKTESWVLECDNDSLVTYFNEFDREKIAREFLDKYSISKLLSYDYNFIYKPQERDLVKDIAREIDFKLPKHYHKLVERGKILVPYEIFQNYHSIHHMKGLHFQNLENYIRDYLQGSKLASLNLDMKSNVEGVLDDILSEHGYQLKQMESKEDMELILKFLFRDEKIDKIFELIEYE